MALRGGRGLQPGRNAMADAAPIATGAEESASLQAGTAGSEAEGTVSPKVSSVGEIEGGAKPAGSSAFREEPLEVTPGLDSLHWAGVRGSAQREADARSVGSSMAAERDAQSLYDATDASAFDPDESAGHDPTQAYSSGFPDDAADAAGDSMSREASPFEGEETERPPEAAIGEADASLTEINLGGDPASAIAPSEGGVSVFALSDDTYDDLGAQGEDDESKPEAAKEAEAREEPEAEREAEAKEEPEAAKEAEAEEEPEAEKEAEAKEEPEADKEVETEKEVESEKAVEFEKEPEIKEESTAADPAAEEFVTAEIKAPEAEPITLSSPVPAAAEPITLSSPVPAAAEPITLSSPVPAAAEPITLSSPVPAAAEPITLSSPVPAAAEPITLSSPVPPTADGASPAAAATAGEEAVPSPGTVPVSAHPGPGAAPLEVAQPQGGVIPESHVPTPQRQEPVEFTEPWERTFKGLVSADGVDSVGRPVVVVDADAVPNNMKQSAARFMVAHLQPLVERGPYVLVLTSRSHRLPGLWVMGAYTTLPRPFRKNVKWIVLVRPTGFLRTVVAILKPFVSHKAYRKIVQIDKLVDIEQVTNGEVSVRHLGGSFLSSKNARDELGAEDPVPAEQPTAEPPAPAEQPAAEEP